MAPRPRFAAFAWICIAASLVAIASSRGLPNRSLLQEQVLISCDATVDAEILRICEDARENIDKNGVDLGGASLAVQVTKSEEPAPPEDRNFFLDFLDSVGFNVPTAVSVPGVGEVDVGAVEDPNNASESFPAPSGVDVASQATAPVEEQPLPAFQSDQPQPQQPADGGIQQQEESGSVGSTSEAVTPESAPELDVSITEGGEGEASQQQFSESSECASLMDEIDRHENLTAMSAAMKRTGMDEYIRGLGGNVTVFVPRDTAFEKLAEMKSTTVAELLEDTQYMEKVLKVHVVTELAKGVDFTNSHTLPTALPGTSLLISTHKDSIFVVPPGGEAGVVQLVDINACNAVLHVIDTVLLPAMDLQITVAVSG